LLADDVLDAEVIEDNPVSADAEGNSEQLSSTSRGFLSRMWVEGIYPISDNRLFRFSWFILFYFAVSLPMAFFGYYFKTVGLDVAGLEGAAADEYAIQLALMFNFVLIPTYFAPLFAVPVDAKTNSRMGRRRPWIFWGLAVHAAILVVGLMFVDAFSSAWVWIAIIAIAMIPRQLAERGIGGLMVEFVPDTGSIGAMISLGYRAGTIASGLLLVSWLFGSHSPLAEGGSVDSQTAFTVAMVVILVCFAVALVMVLLMREGRILRGPAAAGSQDDSDSESDAGSSDTSSVMASTANGARSAWPKGTGTWTKLSGMFNTRTSILMLIAAALIPLGDGFETFSFAWLMNHRGLTKEDIADWQPLFIIAALCGLIGPFLTDSIWDRRKALMTFALASGAAYLLAALAIMADVSITLFMVIWFLVLALTDNMIFTMFAAWPQIVDARMASTHMSIYSWAQSISSTWVMMALGAFVLTMTNFDYSFLYLLAIIGPLLGFLLFRGIRIPTKGDSAPSDPIELDRIALKVQGFVARLTPGAAGLNGAALYSRLRMFSFGVGVVLLLLVGGFSWLGSSTVVHNEEEWSADWNVTQYEMELPGTIGSGQSIAVRVDVDGGVLSAYGEVSYEGSTRPLADPHWEVSMRAPDAANFSDGTNDTNWLSEPDWEGRIDVSLDNHNYIDHLNASNHTEPSLDAYTEWMQIEVRGSREWMYGEGEWLFELRCTDADFANQASFNVKLTVVVVNPPKGGDLNVTTRSDTQSTQYGLAVGAVIGLPLLIAVPAIAYLAGRPVESG
jgi:hypothetical protein